MALSYEEQAALMSNLLFRGKIKVACLTYAAAINAEPPETPAHNTRMKWATSVYQQPDMVATQVQAATIVDPGVQSMGVEITDAELQAAVESTVNKIL